MANELNYETALRLVTAAVAEAEKMGIRISCSVVDAEGLERATLRMDGSFWFTPGIARTKARTAVALGRPTSDVAALAAEHPDLLEQIGEQLAFRPTTLKGGVLIGAAGDLVGGMGVSGAHPDQDVACAEAAIAAVLG